MTNHANRSTKTYAVIVADPNSSELGEIVSQHRSLLAAGKSLRSLSNQRWAYVAERRADGSYPHRVEALDLSAHQDAIELALQAEHRSQ